MSDQYPFHSVAHKYNIIVESFVVADVVFFFFAASGGGGLFESSKTSRQYSIFF